MRDILIVLLAVLFTIMTIILFEIKSMSNQFLTLVIVLLAFIIFYMIVDKIHLFKDSDNEVNINNTDLEDEEMDFEDEALDLVIDNQNVVEVEEETEPNNIAGMTSNLGFKMVMESTENCGIHENIKNPDYTIQNIDTTDFGVIRDKIAQTLN
jgi:hypothetical protein